MGIPPSLWDDLYFALKGEVTCGVVVCANWLTARFHHIGITAHVPTAQAIDAALAANPKLDLLGPFFAEGADMDSIRVRNIIYLPDPFLGIFLQRNLTPAKAWSHLRGAIIDAGATYDCCHIIDWLWVALTRKRGEDHPSPLAMP